MRAHQHAGASARLDTAFARESAEKERHHANQTPPPTKQPNTRKPRQRPTQRKQAKRTKGAHEATSSDHLDGVAGVDGVEETVHDETPTEHDRLFELSEHHPRFGHRMASKRKRGKKGGGSGVTDADGSDDSVGEDDYSIGVDAQNADMLAELMLCANADDSGGTEDHEGTEEERRFDRMASAETDAGAHPAAIKGAKTTPTPFSMGKSAPFGRAVASQTSNEPKATREWAEAALGALVHRNLRDASSTRLIPPLGSATSTQRTPSTAKVNVLPAAARIMQRYLAHQAAVSGSRPTRAAMRSDVSTATVEAARQRLVNGSAAQGLKPVPQDKLGHEQALFNLTAVLFHLSLHTPRRHLQLGAVQARRRLLNKRLTAADQ